jgi:hypothetical protein
MSVSEDHDAEACVLEWLFGYGLSAVGLPRVNLMVVVCHVHCFASTPEGYPCYRGEG